jgi:hypothetical protein
MCAAAVSRCCMRRAQTKSDTAIAWWITVVVKMFDEDASNQYPAGAKDPAACAATMTMIMPIPVPRYYPLTNFMRGTRLHQLAPGFASGQCRTHEQLATASERRPTAPKPTPKPKPKPSEQGLEGKERYPSR